jgi:hypothetical protein
MANIRMLRGFVVVALGLPACYTGLTDGGPGASGADDDGGDGSGDDDGGVPAGLCGDAQTGPSSLRRLTAAQYDNTIADLLGIASHPSAEFTPDERAGLFKSNGNAPVSQLQVDHYQSAAEDLAAQATADLGALLPCDPAGLGEDECARAFIEGLAPRAYRRPLSDLELERLFAVYATARDEGDFANGIRVVLAAVLQSPFFLYHVEFGGADAEVDPASDAVVALDDYELASRLSYFLWDTMPDEELFAAAEAGDLSTEDGLREQADRMLADPRADAALASFTLQWLGVDGVTMVEKNAEVYPAFSPDLAQAMAAETAAFATWVLREGDGKLETLLTADFTVTEDPGLLALYGATLPADHTPGDPVPLDATQRAGLLTHASVLARHAHANQTSPVHRGKLVRENLFCTLLPPPPPDADTTPPDPDPNATTRERFEQHRADPDCAGCHALIDPIGFGFENYDGIGAYRTMEGTLPVDASGEITGVDVAGTFVGAVELAGMLAQSDQVQECMTKQWFRFALGRIEGEADECTTDTMHQAFLDSDGDVRELVRTLVISDSFRFRRAKEDV